MSETIRGIGVSLSIGMADEALSATVSAVTRAAPPVCTATAHGMTTGAVGYWAGVSGMHELSGQACLVHVVDANTFSLPGLDSATWRIFTAGQFRRVTQWSVVRSAVGYTFKQQRPSMVRAVRAFDRHERMLWGLDGNGIATINVRSQSSIDTVRALIESAFARRAALTFRVRLADGRVRVWRGVPSPLSEGLDGGQLGAGTFQVLVDGDVIITRDVAAITPPPIPGYGSYTPPPPPGAPTLDAEDGTPLQLEDGTSLLLE